MACDTVGMSNKARREDVNEAGQWLRRQRERRGIDSQSELARRLGWDKAIVNNYETRGTRVPDDRAEQLAEFFGMDIIEVRRGLGLWVPPEAAADTAEPEDDTEPTTAELINRAQELIAEANEYLRRARGETG